MAISPVTAAASDTTQPTVDKNTLMGNYEAFLQLLTTQLKTQSPLDPLDANQFTQQLVQYSSVEQAMKTNDRLDKMIELSLASQATALLGYVGSEVTAVGSQAILKNGEAEWKYNSAAAGSAQVTIRNAQGAVVKTETIDIDQGTGTYKWDGRDKDGRKVSDGTYSVTIDATDADGKHVDVSTEVKGIVTGVDFTGTEPSLLLGEISVPLGSLRTVKAVT